MKETDNSFWVNHASKARALQVMKQMKSLNKS
jgi:hypothetical protein